MNLVDKLVLSVKRQDNPVSKAAHDVYRWLERWRVPQNDISRLSATLPFTYLVTRADAFTTFALA